MKKFLLLSALVSSFSIGKAQAPIVLDDFNDDSITDWDFYGNCGNNNFTRSEQGGALKIIDTVDRPDCFPFIEKFFPSNIDLTGYNVLKVRYKTTNTSKSLNMRVELLDQNIYTTNGFPPDVVPFITDGNFHDFYFNLTGKWNCGYWPQDQSTGWWVVDSSQIAGMRIYLDYGMAQAAGQDSIWIDDISMLTSMPNPCVTVTDPNLLDNFDTERHVNYTLVQGWNNIMNNPFPTGNSSNGVTMYLKDASLPNAILQGDLCSNLVLSANNQLKMNVYNTKATPQNILISLQNFDGTNRREISNHSVSTTTTNQWETLTFDFKDITDSTAANSFVMILNPGSSVYDSIYIDDIELSGYVSPTGVKENVANIANVVSYPNPFSNKVEIEYSVSTPSVVSVSIIDMLGRAIETIVEEKQMSGKNKMSWTPTNVKQGIYYCVIKIDGKISKTEKLIYMAN